MNDAIGAGSEEEKKSEVEEPKKQKEDGYFAQRYVPIFPLNFSHRDQNEKQTSQGVEKELFKYWIVPDINPQLIEEFQKMDFFQCQEDKKNLLKTGDGSDYGKIRKKGRYNDPNIPLNRKDERTYVHLCWIFMWCGTLWQQDKKEQLLRTNQLLQVISRCKNKATKFADTEMFYMIIDACYKYGMFKMTKRVYGAMQTCHILPSNAIFQCYFQHQKKENKEAR